MYDAKANREYYLRNGRCPKCSGKNKVEPGKRLCRECALKESDRRRERRERWINAGKCARCGGELLGDGFKTCLRCREYQAQFRPKYAQYAKKLAEKRKKDGKCVRCGYHWAELGKTLCKWCNEKHKREYKRYDPDNSKKYARRQARIDAGLCIDCGAPSGGRLRCDRCNEMRRDSTRKYKITQRIKREAEEARAR